MLGLSPGGRRLNNFSHLCEHNAIYLKAICLKLMEIQLNLLTKFGDGINTEHNFIQCYWFGFVISVLESYE